MAQTPPSAGRPGRQLVVLGLISAFLFALMFFAGTSGMSWTERLEPRLGMDLVGGTRVALLATTEDGSPPSEESLGLARQIIASRVNSLGVEEAEVVSEGGERIVVSVAGEAEDALRSVGAPAQLRFRKVIQIGSGLGPAPPPTATPTPSGAATPDPAASPEPSASADPEASGEADAGSETDAGGEGGALRAQTPEPSATPEPGATPDPSATPEPDDGVATVDYGTVAQRQARVEEKISDEAMQAALALADPAAGQQQDATAQAEAVEPFGELTGPEVEVLPAKLQFYVPTITCEQLNDRPAGAVQDPTEMAVACDDIGRKYLLDVAEVLGTDVDDASATLPAGTSRWEVNVSFTDDGQPKWTDLTREAIQNDASTPFDPALLATNIATGEDNGGWHFQTGEEATARNNTYQQEPATDGERPPIQCDPRPLSQGGALGDQGNCLIGTVLDNRVISAPQVIAVQPSDSRITGDFSSEEAQLLASQLRFGALPLTFQPQEEQSITATLGVEYLKAGLLAAAIGFGLVILYVLFYYRLLSVVIIGSLIASSVLTYAALVVLGRGIGYTLTLAGISGFIVAVGIAADSFVIYFERLKDEIRDGRTPRSAVPRAWVRARRTIITANGVTLLAASVLYLLAAGQVRGFAFALGLATVLDLLIVFTFRHPIMTLLARTRAFLSPGVSGLGRALALDREQAGVPPTARAREVEA